MALHTKYNIFVQVLQKQIIDNKEAYFIVMPSGLKSLAWSSELIFI